MFVCSPYITVGHWEGGSALPHALRVCKARFKVLYIAVSRTQYGMVEACTCDKGLQGANVTSRVPAFYTRVGMYSPHG